ncbi:MAG TPA: 4,5-DOPA dioxygenase extradiol [Methanolinea sp.]|nr:4,5-DOPA dioxygenase extradiol [Methanolinea sp.]HRU80668.1 4,5-DOPA dioxygenase extradiol [Methanolinea sp.]
MPVLFIGHGSPMNMVLSNGFTKSLAEIGNTLPRPEAIMVISAHWLTRGTYVTCMNKPGIIYDFYGFPKELYQVKYECPGAPNHAKGLTGLEPAIRCDHTRGLDHASYSVLMHMFPAADIPVFEMSLDYQFDDRHPRPVSYHYALAKKLRPLRKGGILIIGSGNMVHNLRLIDFEIDATPVGWALEADERIKSHLVAGEHQHLIEYRSMGEAVTLGIPTLDHYLPMIYSLALQDEGESIRFFYEGFQNGSISMRGFQIG